MDVTIIESPMLKDSRPLTDVFERDGFVSPVQIITTQEAAEHRARMEWAEARIGPLHYKPKAHTILTCAYELATHPTILDVVEAIIGSNILLYNVEYLVKEPNTPAHVSWHQDLTYWGFNDDAQVSIWLALSAATRESGCMRMVPGSHKQGRMDHRNTDDPTNVLYFGQTVDGVAEEDAMYCDLQPGQASFHHGWTLHASTPNTTTERRIGLNAQYIAPHMRQTALLQKSA